MISVKNANSHNNKETSPLIAIIPLLLHLVCCGGLLLVLLAGSLSVSAFLANYGYTILAVTTAVLAVGGFWYYRYKKKKKSCCVSDEDHSDIVASGSKEKTEPEHIQKKTDSEVSYLKSQNSNQKAHDDATT